jgi:tryptophan-rich sensory protein
MKKILLSILATVFMFFLAIFIIVPILSNWGYSSAEASYHLATHSFIFALIFTVIYCTMIITEKIDELKDR